MDTSEEYIKMCDCPEIQESWDADVGDYQFSRDRLFRPMNIVAVYDGGGWALLPRDANYGWLPRQDQIQRMLWGKFDNPIMKMSEFVDFMNKWLWLDFKTVEQQLLAFYLHEKHSKTWNGERWSK